MALIRIEHDDFDLQISCGNYAAVWRTAAANVPVASLWAEYRCSVGATPQFSESDGGGAFEPLGRRAFFFDNTDYGVFLQTKNGAETPRSTFRSKAMDARLQRFGRNVLTGTLNFGNDIGKFDMAFAYRKDGEVRTFCFTVEILSVKLDYHRDWATLVREIEAEHQTLALDFLKETYHSFDVVNKRVPKDQTADMIWWSLFKTFQTQFVAACRLILNRPRRRWRRQGEALRIDQMRTLSCGQENEFAEFRRDGSHRYWSARTVDDKDTPENRFLKMAVFGIEARHAALARFLLGQTGVSDAAKDEIRALCAMLKAIRRDPFFRGIGRFQGLRQESLVLQRASGYSAVYRIWMVLKRMYALGGDRMRLETKDVATLYEMWCFIRVKNAVAELANVGEKAKVRLKDYVYRLFTGEESRVVFSDASGLELAEVGYNPSARAALCDGMVDTCAPTTGIAPGGTSAERPDIVLRLTKTFGGDAHYKVTYLFDAKYRIQGRYSDGVAAGVDYPPQDAIDQMHRYRDAIYYCGGKRDEDGADEPLKREIVGGYVLFPGAGAKAAVAAAPFMRTREEVNIGAFPLRPGDDANNEILRDFLDALLNRRAWARHVEGAIAQKGMVQIRAADAALSAEAIFTPFNVTPDPVARWIYRNKAVVVAEGRFVGDPTCVRLISIAWKPPVSLIVGRDGYAGLLDRDDVGALFGACPCEGAGSFHVWRGTLANAAVWARRFDGLV